MDQRRRGKKNRPMDGHGDIGQDRKREQGHSKRVPDETRRVAGVSGESGEEAR